MESREEDRDELGRSQGRSARRGARLLFSIGPLILIAIAVAGLLFGEDVVRGQVSAQIEGLLGSSGAQAVQSMLASAGRPRAGLFATIFGVIPLLFAAIGVVVQLKDGLNTRVGKLMAAARTADALG